MPAHRAIRDARAARALASAHAHAAQLRSGFDCSLDDEAQRLRDLEDGWVDPAPPAPLAPPP